MAFYDTQLAYAVRYARHALSIDENRRKFECVPWDEDRTRPPGRDGRVAPVRFRQVWFAGSHSDIGGSYPETESRLSDIALAWMVEEAISLPDPIHIDPSVLKLFPDSGGLQHDERKVAIALAPGWLAGLAFRCGLEKYFLWREGQRRIPDDAELHPSVLARFKRPAVLVHDDMIPYRPEALRRHRLVRHYGPALAAHFASRSVRGGPIHPRRPTPRLATQ